MQGNLSKTTLNQLITKLILLLILGPGFLQAQTASIDTLSFRVKNESLGTNGEILKYPIIKTGNKEVDLSINTAIRKNIFFDEYAGQTIDNTILKAAGGGLVWLRFDVSYNQNGYLSLQIHTEQCRANCVGNTTYLNFSTLTGKAVALSEIIDTSGKFGQLAKARVNREFEVYENEVKSNTEDPENTAKLLEEIASCKNAFQFNEFAIFPRRIEISASCDRPAYLLNDLPEVVLKYEFREISEFILVNCFKP